jgi:type IV fimbrial biogenesis protein FimT
MQTLHRLSGMTLLELLVLVALLGILLTVGIPSLRSLREAQAVRDHLNAFFSTLRYARSEAIHHRAQVVVCPSTNSESASPSCSKDDAERWNQGWIVFVNRDGDSNYSFDAKSDTLLRVQGAITSSGGIEKISGATPNKLVYRNTGVLLAGGASSFAFDAKSLSESQRKRVCISLQGRTRISASLTGCS